MFFCKLGHLLPHTILSLTPAVSAAVGCRQLFCVPPPPLQTLQLHYFIRLIGLSRVISHCRRLDSVGGLIFPAAHCGRPSITNKTRLNYHVSSTVINAVFTSLPLVSPDWKAFSRPGGAFLKLVAGDKACMASLRVCSLKHVVIPLVREDLKKNKEEDAIELHFGSCRIQFLRLISPSPALI